MPNQKTSNFWLVLLPLVFVVGVWFLALKLVPANKTVLSEQQSFASCQRPGPVHALIMNDNAFAPDTLTINHCDRVKIVNASSSDRLIALGPHDNHVHYPGFVEKALQPGQIYTFEAYEQGTFRVHDHITDLVEGTLIVR